ncbi:MAG TPA: hypothetical protein VF655_13755 [Allosphingosinicella sp.]|jgi:hypothetical protein
MLISAPVIAQNVGITVAPKAGLSVRAGQTGEVRLVLGMDAPWYVYAPTGANAKQGLIETHVRILPAAQIQFAPAQFPKAQPYGSFDVLRGRSNVVRQAFRVRPRTPPGAYKVKGYAEYQTCNGKVCLAPNRVPFSFVINVVAG